MSFYHRCKECRTCPKCLRKNCTTYLEPHKLKSIIEGDFIVKKCVWCDATIESFETLSALEKKIKVDKSDTLPNEEPNSGQLQQHSVMESVCQCKFNRMIVRHNDADYCNSCNKPLRQTAP